MSSALFCRVIPTILWFLSLCVGLIQAGEFSTVNDAMYAITVVDLLFFLAFRSRWQSTVIPTISLLRTPDTLVCTIVSLYRNTFALLGIYYCISTGPNFNRKTMKMETFFYFQSVSYEVKRKTQPDYSKPEFKLNNSLKSYKMSYKVCYWLLWDEGYSTQGLWNVNKVF